MRLAAFNAKDQEVHKGDIIHDFRGDPATYIGPTRPRRPGKSGKVLVAYLGDNDAIHPVRTRELYDMVFDLTVIEVLS
jgi:hypothetical protein